MDTFISASDCSTIVSNSLPPAEYKVHNYTVTSLTGQVPGMMAEYYTLTITVASSEHGHVAHDYFCKRKQMFHKIQEIMCREQGAYEKENYIYNVLMKECQRIGQFEIGFAPKCYLYVPGNVLVLEDLLQFGYRGVVYPHTYHHCKLALTAVAQYHALNFLYEEHHRTLTGKHYSAYDADSIIFKDSLYRRDDGYLGRAWFKNCFASVGKLIAISPYPHIAHKYARLEEQTYEIITPSTKYRNVICHGDVSVSNVLFQHGADGEPVSCKLIDYQALRYNPPAHDVLTYIYLVTNAQQRAQHMQDLLQCYYQDLTAALARHGMKIEQHMTEESFYDSCKYVLPMILLQTATYATMVPLDEYPRIMEDQALYKEYVYGDRSCQCVEAYKRAGRFKETIDEMFKEISEL